MMKLVQVRTNWARHPVIHGKQHFGHKFPYHALRDNSAIDFLFSVQLMCSKGGNWQGRSSLKASLSVISKKTLCS